MSDDPKIKLTFNRHERLKSRSTIDAIFIQNRHLRIYPFKLVWVVNHSDKLNVEVGVSVSKRLFKTAVKRNFIKRRMRECYRLNKLVLFDRFKDKNIRISFMLIYIGKDISSYQSFNKKIKQLLIRLGDMIERDLD